ncbi:hypothetical protein CTI12_AA120430 [Artemisia annua]|uniref:Uncharacterized protein n=1 Tax=Artemisia annua TaxID=35608 RepID=A0A2U1PMP4_ARTAN|nr:hypothetical protein CTI12_AA120430 [Artemisia annua]
MEKVKGGSPYGAGTYAGDGSRQPSKLELEQAFHQDTHLSNHLKLYEKLSNRVVIFQIRMIQCWPMHCGHDIIKSKKQLRGAGSSFAGSAETIEKFYVAKFFWVHPCQMHIRSTHITRIFEAELRARLPNIRNDQLMDAKHKRFGQWLRKYSTRDRVDWWAVCQTKQRSTIVVRSAIDLAYQEDSSSVPFIVTEQDEVELLHDQGGDMEEVEVQELTHSEVHQFEDEPSEEEDVFEDDEEGNDEDSETDDGFSDTDDEDF